MHGQANLCYVKISRWLPPKITCFTILRWILLVQTCVDHSIRVDCAPCSTFKQCCSCICSRVDALPTVNAGKHGGSPAISCDAHSCGRAHVEEQLCKVLSELPLFTPETVPGIGIGRRSSEVLVLRIHHDVWVSFIGDRQYDWGASG
jgi:hypothetical protein